MIGERLRGVLSCVESGPDSGNVQVQLQQAQKSHDTASRCTAELFLTLKVQHVGNTGKISKLKSSLRWTEVRKHNLLRSWITYCL